MTIFRKNMVTLGLAAFGFSATLVILALALMNFQYYKTNGSALLDTARILVAVVGEDRLSGFFSHDASSDEQSIHTDLRKNLEAIRGKDSYRLTLIESNGEVLWDSVIEGNMVNHNNRSEIQAVLEGGEGIARRDSLSTRSRQIYAALPVRGSNGAITGVFRLSVFIPGFWQRISSAAWPFLVCAALLVSAALIAVAIFSRSFSGSLKRLVGIAKTAAGKGPYRDSASPIALFGEAQEFIALEAALKYMVRELSQRAEQAEAEGRQFLAILNGMSEAVLAMDDRLILYLANPRARYLFGIDDAQKTSLLAATRSTELEKAASQALTEKRSLEVELKLKASGGAGGGSGAISGAISGGNGNGALTEQLFQVFVTPLSHNGGGLVMVMENITRLVKLEQMRKDFVANVSHELRTPIQLIKGFSETLLDTPVEDKEQLRRCIEIIHKNTGTMENLTNDLLVLASLEDSSGSAVMEAQLLAPLFADAAASVELQAQKKEIEIIVNCPGDIEASVHGNFIKQALINLLDNGIKYSPKNSKIWASAYRPDAPDPAEGIDAPLVLEVKDEGIGIPAKHLERIFERFYRVDRSHSRETGGTGLGLSIVRHIALLHHGTMEVESHAGEGSVFRIKIPG